MVDAVVSFVVGRLGDYLIKEAAFLRGVRSEANSLKTDLAWMLCFIKDAEDRQVGNGLIRQWVSDIRDIAYDCEDVLDEFAVKVHDEETSIVPKVEEGETSGRRQSLFTSVRKCSCLVPRTSSHKESNLYSRAKETGRLYSIGKEIEDLKKRLKEVSDRCGMYGLRDINNKWEGERNALREFKEVRRTTSFAFEENFIGYEDDKRTLTSKLLDNEPHRYVISIWGTGGLGKTTLAKKLYHNDKVKYKFEHCAWICVSQDYNIEDLLRRIIHSFNFNPKEKKLEEKLEEKLEKMGEEALKRYLHKSLEESSYLVVIDDVWGKSAWGRLIEAFPNNKHGSRVIITTRKKDVADCADYVHELPFLDEEESWQLFYAKTRGKANETKEMEKIGKQMLQKCGGLPLAIVVLGGLLSRKSAQEWRLVRDYIWLHLNRDSDNQINYILSLSFNDLPYQLKVCFLYLGYFPEDYEIPVTELIQLWMAEGFIPQNKEIMEDMAYQYLNELISRSLIQKDKMRRERILTCRVHDVLRNLAIEKAEELNLFQIYEVNKGSTCSARTRRLAIFSGTESYLQLQQPKVLRSLFLFEINQAQARREGVLTVCSGFRLLRVLDLSYIVIETIPQEIGKLIHLKYLKLGEITIEDFPVPPFILNLVNLQTLFIEGSNRLPTETCKLKELRHLIGKFKGYFRVDNLKNLQTLKGIQADTWMKTNPKGLVNLRELHISSYGEAVNEFTFDSIAELKSLQILRVYLSISEIPSLKPLSDCPNLVELTLEGWTLNPQENLPAFLPNLEHLELHLSIIEDDPMPTLENLPNLRVLYLDDGISCIRNLVCSNGGFPRLEILALRGEHFTLFKLAEGAMPNLRSVESSGSFRIPERLKILPPPLRWEYMGNLSDPYNY